MSETDDPRDYPLVDEIRLIRKVRQISEANARVLHARQQLIEVEHEFGVIGDAEREQQLEVAMSAFTATVQRAADAFFAQELRAHHGL